MPESSWSVSVDGEQLEGTFNTEEVREMCTSRPVRSMLVWKSGMQEWAAASTIPEIGPHPPTEASPTPRAAADTARAKAMKADLFVAFRAIGSSNFDVMITPQIVRIVYFTCLVVAFILMLGEIFLGLGTMAAAANFKSAGMFMLGAAQAVLGPIITYIALAFIRMTLETVIILFKIKDDSAVIAAHLCNKEKCG